VNVPGCHNGQKDTSTGRAHALGRSAGFRVLDERAVVRMTGDDRVSFLHGMCSADVKGAKPGSILPGLFLTEHAHVIGEFFLWVVEDALIIEAEREGWPRSREHLERFLVADDVEIEETGLSVLDVEGPGACEVLTRAGIGEAQALEPWTCAKAAARVTGCMPRFGARAWSLLGEPARLDEVAAAIAREGAVALAAEELEALRIANGVARIGVDTAEKTIALEARLERAISFNKGCYVGQETIERATARGALKKRMFGLRLDRRIAPGAALLLDGNEVGRVTSSTVFPGLGAIGLGILHHSAWAPGTVLSARSDSGETAAAIVSELPFGDN
jgi:folate-binding protein YgfZ